MRLCLWLTQLQYGANQDCVAETGMPRLVAMTTVVEAESVAANARLGVNAVIELPTVSITLRPYINKATNYANTTQKNNPGRVANSAQ